MNKSGIHEYLDTLSDKVAQARSAPSSTPKIGIFWLYIKDRKIKIFLSSAILLDFGQAYGSFIIDPISHYNFWESFKRQGYVPKYSNYEDLPRGRVSYNKETNKYIIYHGNYIKNSTGIKSIIKNEFNIYRNFKWESDFHYHKFKYWGF